MIKDNWAIGVDLGGTKIEVALVHSSGLLQDRLRIATESQQGYMSILNRIKETINQLYNQNKNITPAIIGIGVPGQISKDHDIVHDAPNLKWHEVNLKDDLSAMLHKQVFICNDVRAATWGEWLYGAGKNCDDLVCVFIGTGIGGGIVSGGRMLTGSNNTAGEIGHISIDINGPKCHCGNNGCFEALAGGWAIARDVKAIVDADRNGGKLILTLAGNDINNITAKTIAIAAQKNDELSKIIIDNLVIALIAGFSTVINAYGPRRLILGGGIMEGMPQLLDRIEKGVRKCALKAAIENFEVLPASLHSDSGVIGAAAFALNAADNLEK
jgi:glucokinase